MSGPSSLIQGVCVKPLKPIPDERGRVMELLRADDALFQKFGQVYITTAYSGVVKAWHYHKIQTDHFITIHGMMKIVLYDSRENSPTRGFINEFFTGVHNPMLVVIPPLVYHGFKGIGSEESILVNVPTEPYNHQAPDEYRLPSNTPDIPYSWARVDK